LTNFSYGDQFNSQNINNNGFVQIGSINIFSTLDLRNNLNYTTKGFFVNASLEHSHTNYFSSKNINFITTDIKTKFYLPLNASFTLSNYINYKYQYNFLDFSIPILRKIKFGSIDDPRGINPKVLNTINSEDITFINLKESHFFNFKTELRYLLTNSLVIGFFVDGGGFTLPSMQYSKGISLKYITPLGSISVDYGSPMRSSFLEGIFTLSLNFF
jgi:outer membrane protein assembly factor BamA